MNESILGLKDYTSSALWRKPEQLRGLIKNHMGIISQQEELLPVPSLLFSSYLVLHPSEDALAVVVNPIGGECPSLSLISLSSGPTLRYCSTARWLSLPDDATIGSLAWEQNKVLLGCSKGRVLLSSLNAADDVRKSSGSLPIDAGELLSTTVTGHSDVRVPSVGDIFSSPFAYAASTMVRSLSVLANGNNFAVTGVCGHFGHLWDIHHSKPLTSWTVLGSQGEVVPVLLARFLPNGGDKIILSGNYEGALALVDVREDRGHSSGGEGDSGRLPSVLLSEGKSSVVDVDFNPLLPYVLSAASTDGMISIFDLRYTKGALHYIPSHQGSLTSIRWLGSRSDLFSTGGIDGSVAIWNLRCPPTFCVGRAQYSSPVMNIATTQTFLQESTFGVTLSGEITQTAMNTESMIGLSRSLHSNFGLHKASSLFAGHEEDGNSAELDEKELEGCGLLYARQVEEGIQTMAECAQRRLDRQESTQALLVADMTEPFVSNDVTAVELLRRLAFPSNDAGSLVAMQDLLHDDIIRSSGKLISPFLQRRIKGLRPAKAEDIRRLASVRINARLLVLLASRNLVDIYCGIPQVLRPLAKNPELFEDIDSSAMRRLVSLVLEADAAQGEQFLRIFLEYLTRLDESSKKNSSIPLIRLALETAQKPLLTEGCGTSKLSKRLEDKFFKDMDAAKDAVFTQLRILSLGAEQRYDEVISVCDQYQSRCIEDGKAGMFGWISLEPLLVYLSALIADENYVALFWTSVQYLEAFSPFSAACERIEELLFSEVEHMKIAGGKLIEFLDYFSDLPTVALEKEHIEKIKKLLKQCHRYLLRILGVQLECENVAIESHIHRLPPTMKRVLEALILSTENVLTSWAMVLDSLMSCPQVISHVRVDCRPLVQDFSSRIEDLVDISPKKENDDCLNEILETCDEFLEVISAE